MENKRIIIALLLMISIWSGYNILFPPAEDLKSEKSLSDTVKVTSTENAFSDNQVHSSEPIKDSFFKVSTDLLNVKFSKNTPSIQEVILNNYTDENGDKIVLISDPNNYAFTPTLENVEFDKFEVNTESDVYISDGKITEVIYKSESDGILVSYIFKIDPSSYKIDTVINIENKSSNTITSRLLSSIRAPFTEEMKDQSLFFVGPSYFKNEKIENVKIEDVIEEQQILSDSVNWISYQTKYFVSGLIPEFPFESIKLSSKGNNIDFIAGSQNFNLNANSNISLNNILFFGPKDIDILKSVTGDFEKNIDFGFFAVLAVPVLYALKMIYSVVGNYGLSIILVTVLIKLIFWPLTNKSYSSMKAMQVLQPQMQKIREKYKTDKEKLNKEIMQLYKTNRVNPLGGCLPMLVQIPVFFALYKVLYVAIELRHAPFIFYINDLSLKDPYYITPVIMGITMFFQMKMSPTTLDPVQAKVMMAMPVVFTFMFLNFPSGLVLYWLVNNLLTILQQYLVNKKKTPLTI